MTLGNMRDLGVKRLIPSCLNYACRHTALIEVWSYPAETEIPILQELAWSAPSAAAEETRSTCGLTGKSKQRSRAYRQRVAMKDGSYGASPKTARLFGCRSLLSVSPSSS